MAQRNHISAGLFVLASAAALTIAPPVDAQIPSTASPSPAATGSQTPVVSPQETVNLTMEQKHIIKEIIIKDLKVEPQQAGVPTEVGRTVPSGIPLQPMPVEVSAKVPQLKSHSFLVKDDKVIIIDPKDNKIAALVE
jgi:hypothetical protein